MALAINWATGCSAPAGNDPQGTGGSSSSAGTTGNGGNSATAGTTGSGGSSSGGNSGTGTGGNASGGNPGTGGSISTAGTTGSAGSSAGTTGSAGRGGTTGSAGSNGGAGATGNAGRGGTTGSAGSTGTAGATGTAGTGVRVDMNGVPLAKPGDTQATSKKYLNLGDMRLINNRWGSDALNCGGTQQSVAVNSDKTVGWTFNRPACGGQRGDPDFPEVEFGVAPFGTASSLLTTPPFSSTTLLPIQIKNLTSASVNVDNFFISFSNSSTAYWDNNVEFWISRNDPRTSADAGVYAEIIAFTGWQGNRLSSTGGWPCDKSGTVTAGSTSFNLCHQSDTWSSGWRFFNFNVNQGPFSSWTGKLDVKAMLNWVMSQYSGFSGEMWLTRIEVGTEIDDTTAGTAKIKNLTFEVNGQNRSFEFAQ
jgi:hypothetical protein